MFRKLLTVSALVFACCSPLFAAPPQNAPHAGQTDTDGILSPGERPNPNIDYDKAQREGEKRGDDRYDNPSNDSAADRDERRDERGRYDWDREHRDDRDDNRDRDYDREHDRPWWDPR